MLWFLERKRGGSRPSASSSRCFVDVSIKMTIIQSRKCVVCRKTISVVAKLPCARSKRRWFVKYLQRIMNLNDIEALIVCFEPFFAGKLESWLFQAGIVWMTTTKHSRCILTYHNAKLGNIPSRSRCECRRRQSDSTFRLIHFPPFLSLSVYVKRCTQ